MIEKKDLHISTQKIEGLWTTTYEPRSFEKAVLLMPALGTPASYYAPFCEVLAHMGIIVVAAELRGQGADSSHAGRQTDHGYHHLASEDWPKFVSQVREKVGPDVPLHLLGHSIGGQISLLYAATTSQRIDGLILVASGSVYFRGFARLARLQVLLGTHFAAFVGTVCGYWPGHLFRFGGKQSSRLMRDWARIARTGKFHPAGSNKDYEDELTRMSRSVFAVSIEGDSLAPASAVDMLCRKAPASSVDRWHYLPNPEDRIDHFRWARKGEEIASRIVTWMDRDR